MWFFPLTGSQAKWNSSCVSVFGVSSVFFAALKTNGWLEAFTLCSPRSSFHREICQNFQQTRYILLKYTYLGLHPPCLWSACCTGERKDTTLLRIKSSQCDTHTAILTTALSQTNCLARHSWLFSSALWQSQRWTGLQSTVTQTDVYVIITITPL